MAAVVVDGLEDTHAAPDLIGDDFGFRPVLAGDGRVRAAELRSGVELAIEGRDRAT